MTNSQPFPQFIVRNGYEDVPIWGYFRFIHAIYLLPTVFWNLLLLQIIAALLPLKLLILVLPAEITDNCLPLRFCWIFLLCTHPWHHQQTKQQKNCLSKQDVNQVIFDQLDLLIGPSFSMSLPASGLVLIIFAYDIFYQLYYSPH